MSSSLEYYNTSAGICSNFKFKIKPQILITEIGFNHPYDDPYGVIQY